jgi:hypothetical protein
MDESDDYDLDEYLAEKSKNQNTRMSEIASIIRSVKKSEFRNSESVNTSGDDENES